MKPSTFLQAVCLVSSLLFAFVDADKAPMPRAAADSRGASSSLSGASSSQGKIGGGDGPELPDHATWLLTLLCLATFLLFVAGIALVYHHAGRQSRAKEHQHEMELRAQRPDGDDCGSLEAGLLSSDDPVCLSPDGTLGNPSWAVDIEDTEPRVTVEAGEEEVGNPNP